MAIKTLSWKIGGEAGFGIMNSGILFGKLNLRNGNYVFTNTEYPSLIRGGYNTYQVMVSEKSVYCHTSKIDILVALNQNCIDQEIENVSSDGVVICGKDDELKKDVKSIRIDWEEFLKEVDADPVMKNMIGVAASAALMGIEFKKIQAIITENFADKGNLIVEKNVSVAQNGYKAVYDQKLENKFGMKPIISKYLFINGNEAISLGAVKAGCKLIAAYPMTPASTVMQTMAVLEHEYNIIVKQSEDEIAACTMVIGANFSGIRAMTATSGGGFALMAEGLGLAGMTETPLVVVEAQRGGPSTGLPTKMEQSDLLFMLHASQGEFPRVVIAPGTVQECFRFTYEAFNLAEKYQMIVIILTDKNLADRNESLEDLNEEGFVIDRGKLIIKAGSDYKRFEFSKDGVSPRLIPGVSGSRFVVTGNEHDEKGQVTEDPVNRVKMVQKRAQKLKTLQKSLPKPKLIGPSDAKYTLVSWGSTKGAITEAMKRLKAEGVSVNYLPIKYIWPLHSETVRNVMKNSKNTVLIEHNHDGQLGRVIKQETGLDFKFKILKYDGFPFTTEGLVSEIKNLK